MAILLIKKRERKKMYDHACKDYLKIDMVNLDTDALIELHRFFDNLKSRTIEEISRHHAYDISKQLEGRAWLRYCNLRNTIDRGFVTGEIYYENFDKLRDYFNFSSIENDQPCYPGD